MVTSELARQLRHIKIPQGRSGMHSLALPVSPFATLPQEDEVPFTCFLAPRRRGQVYFVQLRPTQAKFLYMMECAWILCSEYLATI